MAEYIKREDVLQHKRKMRCADFRGGFWDFIVRCEDVERILAADVVEVRQERLRHRIEKADQRIAEIIKKNKERGLRDSNSWSLGYWIGVVSVLEDWLEDIGGEGEDNAAD